MGGKGAGLHIKLMQKLQVLNSLHCSCSPPCPRLMARVSAHAVLDSCFSWAGGSRDPQQQQWCSAGASRGGLAAEPLAGNGPVALGSS